MKYDIDGLQFRPLHADEIEVRVGTVSAKGATFLLYQDSRCAMNILDETVGRSNWQRDHKELKGNLYCGIAIWDADKAQWTWKWDCGTESNTEKEKGEASDSMKRAAVNWGIARELYTSPFIYVPCETVAKPNGKGYELKNKFFFNGAKVTDIAYDDKRRIKELTICDKNGVVMFTFPKGKKRPTTLIEPKNEGEPVIDAEHARALKDALEATESDVQKFLAYVAKVSGKPAESVDTLTLAQHEIAVKAINQKMAGGNK